MFATFLSGGGVQHSRLLSSFLFLALVFVFSCKSQTNNQTNKPNIPPDIPPKQDEIVITVSGDSNVKIAQSPSFNVLKNPAWASVKVKANQKISFTDGFILKSWHLTNKDGKLLVDTEVFTENTTVFAVSQKENIPPQQNEIVITVSGDSNVKIAQSPSFNVLKNSTWASVKVKANQKISFSDGFVLKSWHLTNKDGKLLVDTEVFTENTTVFAVSQKENIPENTNYETKNGSSVEIVKPTNQQNETYKLKGNIYIDDLISKDFDKKLEGITGNIDTNDLNINCFKTKTNNISGQSITIKNLTDSFEAKEITPEILKGILELKKSKNFSTLRLNNQTTNGPIDIKFNSTIENCFEIKDLNKFTFNNNFNLKNDSKIISGSKEIQKLDPTKHDITPYPSVDELLTLLKNEKLKNYITIKDVYITGNVKDLLPHLIGTDKIKEINGGIKFLNVRKFICPGINVTEYNGGEDNNEPLPIEQFLEFKKRTDEVYDAVIKENARSVRLQNLILANIDTTEISKEDLKLLDFKEDDFTGNITFKDSNLSQIVIKGVNASTANIIFEKITLPYNMAKTNVKKLTLKDITFPKQKIMEYIGKDYIGNIKVSKLNSIVPTIVEALEVYGYIKDSPLEGLTSEQLDKLVRKKQMPKTYKGPEEIYNKLKTYIYKGESNKKEFGKFTSSLNIHKPQDRLLAILKKRQERSHG